MERDFDVIRYVWFFENHYYDFVVIHFACMKSFGHKIDAIFYNYAASGSFTFKYKTEKMILISLNKLLLNNTMFQYDNEYIQLLFVYEWKLNLMNLQTRVLT